MRDITLLIDSSSLLYRAWYSTPDTVRAPDGSPINAAHGFMNMVARLVADCDPSRVACATDEDWRPQWRVDLVPEYKLARVAPPDSQAEADDEVGRQSVFCFGLLAAAGVAVVGHDGCEAEDVIGTLAAREQQTVAIVSGDRDLFQLVEDPRVFVLYPVKGVSEMARIDEAEIARRYGIPGHAYADFAVLRGDPSDGLPGVRGVGDKTAAALLATHGSLEGVVAAARAGGGAGALAKVAAALDYVERATKVVQIPRDLPLPELDLSRPDGTADPDVVAGAGDVGLGGAFERLLTALAGRA